MSTNIHAQNVYTGPIITPTGLSLLDHYQEQILLVNNNPYRYFSEKMNPDIMNPGFLSSVDYSINYEKKLQNELTKLIIQKYKAYRQEINIALVDLSDDKIFNPQYAGWNDTTNIYGASTLKVITLYSFYQLMYDLNVFASKYKIISEFQLISEFNKNLYRSGFKRSQIIKYKKLYSFKRANNFIICEPSKLYDLNKLKSRIDTNDLSSEIMCYMSYEYIASILYKSGIWHQLFGGFAFSKFLSGKSARTCSNNKRINKYLDYNHSLGNNITALSAATFFTLLAQNRLVSLEYSSEISQILNKTKFYDNYFITQMGSFIRNIKHRKIGLYNNYYHQCFYVEYSKYKYVYILLTRLNYNNKFKILHRLLKDFDKLIQDNNT